MTTSYKTITELQHDLVQCDRCVAAGCLTQAYPIFSGGDGAHVMLVGQAPGIKNEAERFPFNGGNAGTRLFGWLAKAGRDEEAFRERHYVCSITRCYPGKHDNGRGDRVPSEREQQLCTAWLEEEICLLQPQLIIPMGKLSINYFVQGRRRLTDVIGSTYEYKGAVVVPLPHASGASTRYHMPKNKPLLAQAIDHHSTLPYIVELVTAVCYGIWVAGR